MCVTAAPPIARGVEPVAVLAAGETLASDCVRSKVGIEHARLDVLLGERAKITGTLEEGDARAPAGRTLTLERQEGHRWQRIASAHTGRRGRFTLSYTPQRTGTETLRVAFAGGESSEPVAHRVASLEVYHEAEASWYGGGGTLACGGELTRSTLGVANRTLPCGTLVTLRYGGRTIRVPVVDRGPFVYSREFDLTEATKRELGFGSTGEVWAIS